MNNEWQHTSVSDVGEVESKMSCLSGDDEPQPLIQQQSPGTRRSKLQAAPPEDVFYTERSEPTRQGKISVPSKTKIVASPEKKLSRDRSQENWTASIKEDNSESGIDTKSRLSVPDELGSSPREKIQDNFEMTKSAEPVSVVSEVQYDMEQQYVSSKRTPVFMRKIQSDDTPEHAELTNKELSQEADENYSEHSKLSEYTLESTGMNLDINFVTNQEDLHDSTDTGIMNGNIDSMTALKNKENEWNKNSPNTEVSSQIDISDIDSIDSPRDHSHSSVNQDSETSSDTSPMEYSTTDISIQKPGSDMDALRPGQWKPNQSYAQAMGRQESLESQHSHNASHSTSINSPDTLTESPLNRKELVAEKWQNNQSYHQAVNECDSPRVQKIPEPQLAIKEESLSLSDEESPVENLDMGCSSSREPAAVMQEKKKRDVGDFFPGAALRHRLKNVQKEVFNDSFYSDASQDSILETVVPSSTQNESEFTSKAEQKQKPEFISSKPKQTAKNIDDYSEKLRDDGADFESVKERIPTGEVNDLAKFNGLSAENESVINSEPAMIQTSRLISDQSVHHIEQCNNQENTGDYDSSQSGTTVKHEVSQISSNSTRETIKTKDFSCHSETGTVTSDVQSNGALSDSDVENQCSYSSDSSGVCRISIGMGNEQSSSHKQKSPGTNTGSRREKVSSKVDAKFKGTDRELDSEVSILTENISTKNNNEADGKKEHSEPHGVVNAIDNKSKPAHLFTSYKRNSPDQFLGLESPEGGVTSGKQAAGSKDNFVSVVMCGDEGEGEMEPTQMMEKCINSFTGLPIVPQQVVLNQRQGHRQSKPVPEEPIRLESEIKVSSSNNTAVAVGYSDNITDDIADKGTRYDSVNFYSDDDGDDNFSIKIHDKLDVPNPNLHNEINSGHIKTESTDKYPSSSFNDKPMKQAPSSPLLPPSEYRSDHNVPKQDIRDQKALTNGTAEPKEIHSPPAGKKPVPPPRKSSVKAKFLASIGKQKQSISSDQPPEHAMVKSNQDENMEESRKDERDASTMQQFEKDEMTRKQEVIYNGYPASSKQTGHGSNSKNIVNKDNEMESLVVGGTKSEILASTPVMTNSPTIQSGILNSSLPGRQNSSNSILVEDDYVPDPGEALIRSRPPSAKSSPRGQPPESSMDKLAAPAPRRDPVRDIMNLSSVPHVDASVLSQDIILDGSLSFLKSVGSDSGLAPVRPERHGQTVQPGLEEDDSVFTPGPGSAFTPSTAQDMGSRFSFLNQGLVASPSLHEQSDSSSASEVG